MEQTISSDTGTGSWPVCDDYALRSASEEAAREKADGDLGPYRVVPEYFSSEEDRWKWYFPLREAPELFVSFARLTYEENSLQTALAWYHKYGSLGTNSKVGVESAQPPGESVEIFFREVEQAAAILLLCELVAEENREAAERLIREDLSQATKDLVSRGYFGKAWERGDYLGLARAHALSRICAKFSPSGLPYSRIRLGSQGPPWILARQNFRSLLEAMYVQVYEAMAEGGRIIHCVYCGRVTFLAPPLPGSKSGHWSKKFCSNQCRQKHQYYTKTKPNRQRGQKGKS